VVVLFYEDYGFLVMFIGLWRGVFVSFGVVSWYLIQWLVGG